MGTIVYPYNKFYKELLELHALFDEIDSYPEQVRKDTLENAQDLLDKVHEKILNFQLVFGWFE